MCTNCLRHGWRGIQERGEQLILLLDSLNIWPKSVLKDGRIEVHSPGKKSGGDMVNRLNRLWNFIRLELPQHFKLKSNIGAHCLSLRLGSLSNEKLNSPCKHKRSDGTVGEMPAPYTQCDSVCHHVHSGGDIEKAVKTEHMRVVHAGMDIAIGTKVCNPSRGPDPGS